MPILHTSSALAGAGVSQSPLSVQVRASGTRCRAAPPSAWNGALPWGMATHRKTRRGAQLIFGSLPVFSSLGTLTTSLEF
jgi:hypothetical protein